MADDDDIFAQINHSILDLQGSGPQSFHRPLKRLSELLHNDDLRPFNEKLVANLDLDGFINASLGTGGSMAGSQKLQWPDDNEKCLGLIYMDWKSFRNDLLCCYYNRLHLFRLNVKIFDFLAPRLLGRLGDRKSDRSYVEPQLCLLWRY
jgi:hypothetical protein